MRDPTQLLSEIVQCSLFTVDFLNILISFFVFWSYEK